MPNNSVKLPGLLMKKHFFEVPLNYDQPNGTKIEVFARELVAPDNSNKADLPWMLYLQGGPGLQSPRPEGLAGMWMPRALKDYRVLLLDQRGTGLSTPQTHQTIAAIGNPKAQADYLRNFRADNIVKDCEIIRKQLAAGRPWTVLGQSFGGFCLTTYLSYAPEGLSGAILTGGLQPLCTDPDPVYRATYPLVLNKNRLFYERYPEDIQNVKNLLAHLNEHQCIFASGERISARRFLQLGLNFGVLSGFEKTHYLLEEAMVQINGKQQISYKFAHDLNGQLGFNINPLYAILHESIYCQNKSSRWSADRLLAEFPQFGAERSPVMFTGEMVYRWMFDEYACLRPLKEAAEILANYEDWPELYDKSALKKNTVPTVAAVYCDDMYVDRTLSEKCASNINGIKLWITNEYEHDGIRADGDRVLDRLLGMLHGTV